MNKIYNLNGYLMLETKLLTTDLESSIEVCFLSLKFLKLFIHSLIEILK